MIEEFFVDGIAEIIGEIDLRGKLKSGKKLRVKFGADPTRPDIHIGHAVVLRKMKMLQDAGHQIIFLIGDYTTKIGDPTGRNTTRPVLTDEEIKINAKTYFDQVGKILDLAKTEIRYNSEWYSKMTFNDILQIAGKFTVAQIIERDDFEKRLKSGSDIGLHEMLYPVMQAYDSVVLEADIEFGGNDQKFNMLAGRDLQRKMGQARQDIVILDLLVGTDGKIKMSKSCDNYIGVTDEPKEMFGKIMSIPDDVILIYFKLATNLSAAEINQIDQDLKLGKNPRDIKVQLAFEITKIYHGEELANEAKTEFFNVFSNKQLPNDIPSIVFEYGNYDVPLVLVGLGAASSNTDARRLIEQGAVRIDGARITDAKASVAINKDMLIQVGKHKYFKIK